MSKLLTGILPRKFRLSEGVDDHKDLQQIMSDLDRKMFFPCTHGDAPESHFQNVNGRFSSFPLRLRCGSRDISQIFRSEGSFLFDIETTLFSKGAC